MRCKFQTEKGGVWYCRKGKGRIYCKEYTYVKSLCEDFECKYNYNVPNVMTCHKCTHYISGGRSCKIVAKKERVREKGRFFTSFFSPKRFKKQRGGVI